MGKHRKYAAYLEYWVKIGSYQFKKSSEGAEIKVCVFKFGYIKKFKDAEDLDLIKILAFCKAEGLLKVQGRFSDELFCARVLLTGRMLNAKFSILKTRKINNDPEKILEQSPFS